MTPELAELKGVAEAATPGPWTTDYRFGEASMVICDDVGRMPLATTALYPLAQNKTRIVEANAAHIAAFNPQTALALIAEVERLRSALEPFAKNAAAMARFNDSAGVDLPVFSHPVPPSPLSVAHFRAAQAALSGEPR